MTPEQHAELLRNLKLNIAAKNALLGRSNAPAQDLAALLKSDTPISKQVRDLLAHAIGGEATREGLPTLDFSGLGHKGALSKVAKRIGYLQIAYAFRASGETRDRYAEVTEIGRNKLDNALEWWRAFEWWRANEAPRELLDHERVGIDLEDLDAFLWEQFAAWAVYEAKLESQCSLRLWLRRTMGHRG